MLLLKLQKRTGVDHYEQSTPVLILSGGEEIRTLAPAKPTYRISNPDPSTTWVHLHLLKIDHSIYNLLIDFLGKLREFC